MPLRVIEIDSADNFHSIRHRLLFNRGERAVLVLPERDAPVSVVDLALLRRLADRERLDVGLVTGDRRLARDARALGLPTFSSLLLAEYYRPGWWRARRRPERIGFAAGESMRAPVVAPLSGGIWRRVLLGLIVAILIKGVLAAWFLPAATVTLKTRALPVQAIFTLTADPATTVASDQVIPARLLTVNQAWEATGPTTTDEADRQRIAAQSMQSLGAAAPGILSARLDRGEWLIPSSVSVESHAQSFVAAGDSATLQMDAAVTGLAVREADLRPAIMAELSNALTGDYAPDPAGIQAQIESFAGAEPGQFQVTATTVGYPTIDTSILVEEIRGRQASDAARRLSASLPLAEPPTIDVRPAWWWGLTRGRLPLRAERIRIEIVP